MSQAQNPPWRQSDRAVWETAVSNWLTEAGGKNGLGDLVMVEQVKDRPWSLIYRVQYEKSSTYFKACGSGGRHEPQL